ncbi:MAG: hypothetical protein Q7T89_08875 [Anaerolineales bacterium]|nr:hypothetical protein [Anaerolineales bacterium]
MPITYATSHIDGGLDCSSLSIGTLKSMPDSPIVKAMVIAGHQAHPIWALDRLSIVIYCYVQSAKYHYPGGPLPIQVNIRSSLISNTITSCIVADSIIWHTSETIRSDAERLIAQMTSDARLTSQWPVKTEMALPVNCKTYE